VSTPLLAVVAGLGVAHLVAYYGGRHVLAGMLKPLPIWLLAWVVATGGGPAGARYAGLVAVGLVLSSVGDVSLAFPAGFIAGLSAFLLAHCFYVAAFAGGAGASQAGMLALPVLVVVAGAMLAHLWPHIARLRLPVVVYVAALATMVWCAIARAGMPSPPAGALAAAVGAVSFLVSDGVLSIDRFARPFAGAHAIVMVTYYLAQALIAASAA
jgi:alkenylglycerophosphocholine/alkenylglycerophosphoethanolamine hydrolase